jgi:hypothetical protein
MKPVNNGERVTLERGGMDFLVGNIVLVASRTAIDPKYIQSEPLWSDVDFEYLSAVEKTLPPLLSAELIKAMRQVANGELDISPETRKRATRILIDYGRKLAAD